MIRKKRLKKYLNNKWSGMIKNLSTLSISNDREAIHELRLDGKKIMTIAVLLNIHKSNLFKSLKMIMKHAGNIRMAELNLQTLKDNDYHAPGLTKELEAIIEKGYILICIKNENYKTDIRLLKRRYENSLIDVKDQMAIGFFTTSMDELGSAFLLQKEPEELHENRKKMKHLLYAYRLLPGKLKREINLDKKYLDQLQEEIGLWHDLELALTLLDNKGLNNEGIYCKIKQKQKEVLKKIRNETKIFKERVKKKTDVV
jgi:CHAD domain-containing protein